ncbi:MAG: hypothetical protein V7L11_21965 [Nostoc sp.]
MDGQAGSPEFVVINQADNWVMLNAYFISECSDTLGIGHWALGIGHTSKKNQVKSKKKDKFNISFNF